jgi:hypothetical protein
MDDDTILGPALVEAAIPNERSWWQISAVSVLIVGHVVSLGVSPAKRRLRRGERRRSGDACDDRLQKKVTMVSPGVLPEGGGPNGPAGYPQR